jgi:hypothetical protein
MPIQEGKNMGKCKTKLLTLLGALMLFVGIWALPSNQVQAATPKYQQAYNRIIKNSNLISRYQDVSYIKTYFGSDYGWDKYFAYDLDKNGTPELFVYSSSMGLTAIFTYKKKLIPLGIYFLDRINTSQKTLVVHGHWHGAGGSGKYEWTTYSMDSSKTKIKIDYDIDILNGKVSVYNGDWKLISSKKSVYNKIYKTYIKNARKLSKFKRKSL